MPNRHFLNSATTTTSHLDIWQLCKDNISRITNLIDYELTFLQRHLLSCDLNIWLSCIRSSKRFIIVNPLYKTTELERCNENNNSVLRSQSDMADNFATALFARILLWGHGAYVKRDRRYLPSDYQTTIENTQKSKILSLTNDINLPSITDIQTMLRKSITTLPIKRYALLQSIMMDLWALQTFAEPIPVEERVSKRHQLNSKSLGDTEESDEENDSNDEDANKDISIKKATKTDFDFFEEMAQSTKNLSNSALKTPDADAKMINISMLNGMPSSAKSNETTSTTTKEVSSNDHRSPTTTTDNLQ